MHGTDDGGVGQASEGLQIANVDGVEEDFPQGLFRTRSKAPSPPPSVVSGGDSTIRSTPYLRRCRSHKVRGANSRCRTCCGAGRTRLGVQIGAPKGIDRLSLVQMFVLIFQGGSSF